MPLSEFSHRNLLEGLSGKLESGFEIPDDGLLQDF